MERYNLNIDIDKISLFYACTSKSNTIQVEINSLIYKNKFYSKVAIPIQKHTDNVSFVKSSGIYNHCDGLISNLEFPLILSISVADCVPICIYDSITGNYGLIHSGWRGTSKKIANKAIEVMVHNGSLIKDIKIHLGPSISQDKYEVDKDVASLFPDKNYKLLGKKFLLDIKSQIKDDLLALGIKDKNISSSSICTYSNLDFPSYRRDGSKTGRIIFLMGQLNG